MCISDFNAQSSHFTSKMFFFLSFRHVQNTRAKKLPTSSNKECFKDECDRPNLIILSEPVSGPFHRNTLSNLALLLVFNQVNKSINCIAEPINLNATFILLNQHQLHIT
jgi:hypothetical protein